jgi:DNA-binding MarR family transcriptional regulator
MVHQQPPPKLGNALSAASDAPDEPLTALSQTALAHKGPAQDIVQLLRRMVSRIYVDSKRMNKRFGLTGPQTLVLRALLHSGPISSAALAKAIFVTPSNLTGIIDRLEQKGLVTRTRQATDRRVQLLDLTEAGKEKAESLPDPIEEKLAAGLALLDEEQAGAIRAAIEQVVGFIDAERAPDVPFDATWSPEE